MNLPATPSVFRTEDAAATPVAHFHDCADIIEALFQSIQGGEQHGGADHAPGAQAGAPHDELARYELDNIFDTIAPLLAPGGTMFDLGSGVGKAVLSAALAFPFKHCVGIEALGPLHRMAEQRLDNLLVLAGRAMAHLPAPLTSATSLTLPFGAAASGDHLLELGSRIDLIEGDLFEVDVSGASLVWLCGSRFAPLMDPLAAKLARELRDGALVVSATHQLPHPAFTLLRSYPAATLAWTGVSLYRRGAA